MTAHELAAILLRVPDIEVGYNVSLSILLGPLMRGRRHYRASWRGPVIGAGIALGVVILRYLLGRLF